MSKSGTSLAKNPKVIVLARALAATVAACNLLVLLPARSSPTATLDLGEEELLAPDDLRQVTLAANAHLRAASEAAPSRVASAHAQERDPFQYGSESTPNLDGGTPSRQTPGGETALTCTAVFLGQGPSAALVAGRILSVGDRIKHYRVQAISDKGVTLTASRGNRFLPLDHKRDGGTVGAPVALGQ